jgi:hypothetical protein
MAGLTPLLKRDELKITFMRCPFGEKKIFHQNDAIHSPAVREKFAWW